MTVMLDLVRTPNCWFSHAKAHIAVYQEFDKVEIAVNFLQWIVTLTLLILYQQNIHGGLSHNLTTPYYFI